MRESGRENWGRREMKGNGKRAERRRRFDRSNERATSDERKKEKEKKTLSFPFLLSWPLVSFFSPQIKPNQATATGPSRRAEAAPSGGKNRSSDERRLFFRLFRLFCRRRKEARGRERCAAL